MKCDPWDIDNADPVNDLLTAKQKMDALERNVRRKRMKTRDENEMVRAALLLHLCAVALFILAVINCILNAIVYIGTRE